MHNSLAPCGENMEQRGLCGADVYQILSMSAENELSSEDVGLLFSKVFHVPTNITDAHSAMKKIAGDDNNWSCNGETVLDVLLEMDRERERQERLYWDFQMLNTDSTHTVRGASQQRTDVDHLCTEGLVDKKEVWNRMKPVKRLKKAAGRCWARIRKEINLNIMRLVSEGVQSILSASGHGEKQGVPGQVWGHISLSDVLLMVQIKYDVVAHLLYTEMLQEDYTQSLWGTFLPLQQQREVELVEDLAEEALEHLDMLSLAKLPGAFRIYKACLDATLENPPEIKEESWSAVSLLHDLHKFRQEEKKTLAALGRQLSGESLRLMCLYIRFATLRANQEKISYCALMAARQSWETWPKVLSPCRAEQAALWLQSAIREEEEKENFKSIEQKETLQLLVLTQEQERKHLVKLLQEISKEDLEGSVLDTDRDSLKAGCVKILQHIYNQLLTNLQTQRQPKPKLEDCTKILVTNLMDHQEMKAANLLRDLLDGNIQHIKTLRDEYKDRIQTQNFTNLLHLLVSDDLPTLMSSDDKKTNKEELTPQVQNINNVSSNNPMADSVRRAKTKQTAAIPSGPDICSDCGAVVEDLPYLEVLCVTETHDQSQESQEKVKEDVSSESWQSYEKQASLIPLAWSKCPEDETDHNTEAPDETTEPSQVVESLRTEESTMKIGQLDDAPEKQQPELKSEEKFMEDQQPLADDLFFGISNIPVYADGDETEMETSPTGTGSELWDQDDLISSKESAASCSFSGNEMMKETSLEKEHLRKPVSALEREKTMQNLVDIQKKVEQKQQRDRDRQWLRVQERLSIIQNRKAEEDLLGLKHSERLKHLTQDLPPEDKNQQKTVVRERLEQLRRERSYIMQSRRDRNTTGFKELLAPVTRHSSLTEDEANSF